MSGVEVECAVIVPSCVSNKIFWELRNMEVSSGVHLCIFLTSYMQPLLRYIPFASGVSPYRPILLVEQYTLGT